MSKKSRLAIILTVLALCFWFLWPSLSWYVRTPKDAQALALGSLEKIKDYSSSSALKDVEALKAQAKENPDALLTADQKWLLKAARKNYKAMGKSAPSPMTLREALLSFDRDELVELIEKRYRDEILKNKNYYKNSVKLGLDLSGGMNVIVKADLDAVVASVGDSSIDTEALKAQALQQTIETLTSRIDRFGLSEPVIRQQGEDRIYIELPGAAETDQINSIIMGKGILNFRIVDSEATNSFLSQYMLSGDSLFDSKGNLIDPTLIPEDDEVLGFYTQDDYGLDLLNAQMPYVVVKKEVLLDGKSIKKADIGQEQLTGRPTVNFELDAEGAQIFGDFTAQNIGTGIAIVSDNRIKSYATIREAIPNGNVQISGFSQTEAQNLQKVLQTAWLDVPLTVESQQVIGASLGDQAIRQGVFAILAGLVAIMVFMLIWYKGAGVNACVAQVLNLYIMFSILSAFNLTITLPSIAGMILTIGMAVDANVLIFERIKEERRLGKDRATSIANGFGNALWAILDSNITTFIAAIFMSQLGSGSIQGFAVSLAIGVCSTVFTALVVSRLMFDFNTEALHKQNISIGWGIK